MRAEHTYDYAIIRVVPRVERGEFINVGVILSCPHLRFPRGPHRVRYRRRLLALDAAVDVDAMRANLDIDSAGLPGRRRGRRDWRAAAAQPLSLAGVTAQHDHSALARSYRTNRRPGCRVGASARHDGETRHVESCVELRTSDDRSQCSIPASKRLTPLMLILAAPVVVAVNGRPRRGGMRCAGAGLRGFSFERPIKASNRQRRR